MLSNIREIKKFAASVADWSIFNGTFSNPKIRIADLDGAVEVKGHLLILETKTPLADLSLGQKYMYENLTKQPDAQITVFVLWGQENEYTRLKVYRPGGLTEAHTNIDNEFIKAQLRKWETYARSHSRV